MKLCVIFKQGNKLLNFEIKTFDNTNTINRGLQ